MKPSASLRRYFCIASSSLLFISYAHAASGTWLGTSGDWGNTGTWSSGTIADGTGFTANFTGVNITADQIINLDAARTIGNITFTDTTTSSNNLTISGANILTLDVASGASLIDVTQADRTLTISSQIAGADGLQKNGLGTLILSGDNSYSGVTAISAGILAISHSNALGNTTGNTTITATGATGGPQLQLSGNINSSENITINGSSDANQYVGAIINTSGTNTLSGNITLATPTGSIRIASDSGELIFGGTITQTGATRNLRLLARSGASITVNNAIANNGGILDILGNAGGAATGIVTLKAASTGIGATTINENGTLKLGITNAINPASNLTLGVVSGNAGFDFATFDLAGFNQTVAGLIGLKNTSNIGADNKRVVTNSASSGTSLLTVGNGNATATFNGVILNGATAAVALTKIGTGTQTLNGASTYNGATTVSAGTLKAGVASVTNVSGAFGNNSAVTMANVAATSLDITGFNTQIGSLTGGGTTGGNVTLGAATLTVGGDNTSPVAYAGVVSGTGGVTKIGTGTQILSGTNTYTGGTNVSAGTLTFAGSSSGTLGVINVGGGGTTELKIQAGSYTQGANGFFVGVGGAGIVSQTGGTVAWNSNNLQLLIGNGGSAGTYNLSGGSLTTLTGAPGRGVMLGVNDNSSATFNLSDTGTLTVAGTSRLMIGRSDSTQINTTNLFSQTGGTATISDMTMGGTTGGAGSGNSATLTLTGGTFTATAFSLLSAANNDVSTINIGGTAVVTLPNLPTARGTSATATIHFDGGTLRNSATGTFITGLTNAFIQDGGATFDTSLNSTTITQNLLTHGSSLNGGLTKIGTNTLTLSGTNTYTGATAVNVGTLQAGAAAGGQAFGNGSAVTLANVSGATLSLNGFNQTIGSLAGGGITGGNVTLGANATLTAGGNNTNTSYAGVISGTGTSGLTKTGNGILALSGVNTYTGATNITAGKLTINSTGTINTTSGISIGAGEFNYNSSTALSQSVSFSGTGGTLSGSSTITPAVNVTTGNILAIGNSNEGVMNFGSNLEIGGTYLFEINNTTNTADLGDVAGNLTLGGILDLVQLGAYAIGDKFTLLSYDGTLTGLFKDFGGVTSISDDTNFDDGGGTWTLNYNDATAGLNGGVSASNTYVTITAIPEPSAALLVGLGLLCLLRRRRN